MLDDFKKYLIIKGYTLDDISDMSDEDIIYKSTGLTFNNETINTNAWYIPGGAINYYENAELIKTVITNDLTLISHINTNNPDDIFMDICIKGSKTLSNNFKLELSLSNGEYLYDIIDVYYKTLTYMSGKIVSYPSNTVIENNSISLSLSNNIITIQGKDIDDSVTNVSGNSIQNYKDESVNFFRIGLKMNKINASYNESANQYQSTISIKCNALIEHSVKDNTHYIQQKTFNNSFVLLGMNDGVKDGSLKNWRLDTEEMAWYTK